jgi:two-component system LytT family response regulator
LKTGKKILISRTLKEVAGMLVEQENFFRVHNSFLVNLNEIKNYIKTDGGYLIMSNDGKVKVSRNKKDELLDLFQKFK